MIPATATNRIVWLPFMVLFITAVFFAAWSDEGVYLVLPFGALLFYAGWKFPEIAFCCLLFSLPFSFEYHFSSGWSTDFPDEPAMILISLFAVASSLRDTTTTLSFVRHPLVQCMILWFAWMLLTAAFSTFPVISAKFVLAKTWYAGAFLLAPVFFLKNKKNLIRSGHVFITGIVIVVLIILLRHSFSGFRFDSINEAVSPFFRNHVNYSAMLVCSVPLIIVMYYLNEKRNRRRILLLLIAIILPALFFSYARGAWLALGTGLAGWWLIRNRLLFFGFLATVILSIAVFSWMASDNRYVAYAHDYKTTIFHADFREHLRATYELKDISAAERYYRWIAAARMTGNEGLTGYGPGTFYNNYSAYTVPAFKTWVSNNPERSTAHNYFLLTAAEQGLPGLILLLLLLGSSFWYAQRLYIRCADPFYKGIAAAAGIMLVMIATLNLLSDLVETDKVGSLFFLAISLLIITDMHSRKVSDPAPDMKRIP